MDKIVLTEEKETLLIPLFGKAKENEKKPRYLLTKRQLRLSIRLITISNL